jgi:benzoylsuccinyl-CoA thiolase BbsA subunit
MADDEGKKIPIKEGLFRIPSSGDPGHLIGGKCKGCGEVFHPRVSICPNCFSEEFAEIPLSRRGKVYTYTVPQVGFPGAPLTPPFISAQVELAGGPHVLSLITGIEPEKVQIGMDVELCFWDAGKDEQGNTLVAYAFRPVSA